MEKKVYQIAEYVLDTQTRRFFHKNKLIELSSRAFDILSHLIQKRGEIVDKDELLQVVWMDSFVEENNLAVHISALRRILNEKRGESRFIKTISGRGYSFIAPIKEINLEGETYNELSPFETESISVEAENSIAILNFTFDEHNSDIEYLANGLTQSLISDLSQIPDLKVMAYSAVRTYKNSALDLNEIGFLLGVQKLLTGHISDYKSKLVINVELINASDKRHLWGAQHDFDFSDILDIRKKISLSIAEKLKLQFPQTGTDKIQQQRETNSDAFKFYLKGKYILESISTRSDIKKDLNQALRFFRDTLKENSRYALAYVGIGETYIAMFHYNVLGKLTCFSEAKKSLQLALNLNPELSEAHTLKGTVSITFEGNLPEAEKSLEYAISLNANNPESYHWLSFVNVCFGNFKKALSLQKKAVQLDPTSIPYNSGLLRVFYFSEDYSKSITQAEEILELDSRSVPAHFFLAMTYAQINLFDESLSYIEKAFQLRPTPEIITAKAYIYALMGNKEAAEKIISNVLAETSAENIDHTYLATVYSALNDNSSAFAALEKAYEKGGTDLTVIKVNPKFKNLHSDERFNVFLKKLNLA
jgi:DNA-binding winged helix-turn-helix (wHTH) protein/Flp pilus assembly protein TadD